MVRIAGKSIFEPAEAIHATLIQEGIASPAGFEAMATGRSHAPGGRIIGMLATTLEVQMLHDASRR